MEVYLHAAINGRAANLVREHRLRLPALERAWETHFAQMQARDDVPEITVQRVR